jgi:hypothetical protein
MAALVAFGFTGCKKENPAPFEKGTASNLSISFQVPATKLADGDVLTSTPAESTINNISVFVFESDGSLCATGGFTPLTLADFDVTGSLYRLKDVKFIETLSGTKRIYVGANLPASVGMFSGNEAALLAITSSVASMSAGSGTFAMFSDVVTATLAADDVNTVAKESTLVPISIKRVVAKVITTTTSTDSKFTVNWTDTNAPLQLVYTVKTFRPIVAAQTSFVAPNYWSLGGIAKTYPGIAPTPSAPSAPFVAFATEASKSEVVPVGVIADANLADQPGFYIGENYPVDATGTPAALNGNTTYVYVTTTVTANMAASWDGTQVVWTSITPYGGGTGDIYVVSMKGNEYVTDTKAKADAIAIGLGFDTVTPANNAAGEGIFTYKAGYINFVAWLNKNDMNNYAVVRNEFIHVKVTGIKAQNFFFPGYPGNPLDPSKPTDPTIPTDPNNPDPIKPTDPVDGGTAWLDVDVTVMPWTYRVTEQPLQ